MILHHAKLSYSNFEFFVSSYVSLIIRSRSIIFWLVFVLVTLLLSLVFVEFFQVYYEMKISWYYTGQFHTKVDLLQITYEDFFPRNTILTLERSNFGVRKWVYGNCTNSLRKKIRTKKSRRGKYEWFKIYNFRIRCIKDSESSNIFMIIPALKIQYRKNRRGIILFEKLSLLREIMTRTL